MQIVGFDHESCVRVLNPTTPGWYRNRNGAAYEMELLVIAGRDRWNADHLVVEGIDEKIKGKQLEYGTVNAVYTFLQDQLGVRWLWPGELGEDVPQGKTIAIALMEYRYHPQIRARGGLFNFSALSNRGHLQVDLECPHLTRTPTHTGQNFFGRCPHSPLHRLSDSQS